MSKIFDKIKKMGQALISSFHVKSKTEDKSYLDANTKKGKELAKSMDSALREINSHAEKRKKEEEERIARLNDSSNKPRTIPSDARKIVETIRRNRDSITIEERERLDAERLKELYKLKGGGVIPPRRTRTPRAKSTPVQDEKLNKSNEIDRDIEL